MGFFNRGMYFNYVLQKCNEYINNKQKEEALQMIQQTLSELCGVIILVYHEIGYEVNQYSITPETFERQIQTVRDKNLNVITYEDVKNGHINYEKINVIITFDDARFGVYRYGAPILSKYNIPSMLFIAPEFQEDYAIYDKKDSISQFMTWNMIRKFMSSNQVEIGAHSYTHKDMSELKRNEIVSEIQLCNEKIEQNLGVKCEDFAYPYGKYNEITKEEAIKVYKTISTTSVGFNTAETSPLHLKRTVILNMFSEKDFREIIDPIITRNKFQDLLDKIH